MNKYFISLKSKTLLFLSGMTYRILTLIRGKLEPHQLEKLMQKYIDNPRPSKWNKIITKAYEKELVDYTLSQDLWGMRENDDPFLSFPKLEQYESEFKEVASRTSYAPGGIIFSEAFLLYSMVRSSKPEVFIESGTMNAVSSYFTASALKKNQNSAKMFCLSLFENDEYKIASEKLKPYDFVTLEVGGSQELIDKLMPQYAHSKVAFLIDGPKARSASWDILTKKIATHFTNILFICFDSMQDHVPYSSKAYNLTRGINVERIKVMHLYQNYFNDRNYQFFVPGNQFCRKFHYLNEELYKYRNERWGKFFPWAPYHVDRIPNHYAHSYKLGCIYKNGIM